VISSLLERWELTPAGPPFAGGTAGTVVPVVRADGTEAVLKVTSPHHREAREEAAGLRLWAGRGAVLLYEEDRSLWALLIERCRPGSPVVEVADAAAVLNELWSVPVPDPSPFETVADVCREWAGLLRWRMAALRPPFDAGLVALGASLLESLPASASRSVVVHGDFNPGNVLSASRRPWLAIDAKPMVGDPGYDPMPLLVQLGPGSTLVPRYEEFASLVGEPVERLYAWSVARLVESSLWHVSRHELSEGDGNFGLARRFAALAGL
jgi:streptomycin 6-kinase